ncbi:NAD(P)H-dependent flavin oxidoreductase [Martelella limonii]|uniref:NAD(P)H-dependent flavin oxidoreductase n=1 Tax=Martelella limonii TaxID=1647649 RepID=UPI0015806B1F|nr:nitronate monooxygenase [Martelella limonii]
MLNTTSLPARLRLPVIAAPMFLASGPQLVTACCRAGICGTFPALNQRTSDGFALWLDEIAGALDDDDNAAPYGVNLIVHKTNARLQADLEITIRHKVPLVITSLGAVRELVDAVHSYGGLVFHDVTNRRHAEKAVEAGVDGIIAVAAGAGGHAGTLSPFALVSEIRSFFSGPIALSGAISTGAHIAAARALGADFAYIGTRFLATEEAIAPEGHKRMIVDGSAADIIYTPAISGVPANFLKPSIVAAGLDPDDLPAHQAMDLGSEAKAWKTVWSAGQGIGAIDDIPSVGALVDRLDAEYRAACARL